MSSYDEQSRGNRGAYERYLAGMDASMQQKVALTAAHLLGRGRVADMGMGSGTGSHSLAALHPELEVVGVDVNPEMVELATKRYDLPNLRFVRGDIGRRVFEPESLEGIFDSSVLHHVTSFSGYRHDAAFDALRTQIEQLVPHGVLIVRDFLDPGDGPVLLDLRADDGDDTEDPRSCSTAALFERFAREFRSLSPEPGFSYRRVDGSPTSLRPGWRRYAVSRTLAAEFVLRKDYRDDWESEVKEEYTYATQARFEAEFAAMGLRVLASCPIHNPWIVQNRFVDRFALWSEGGDPLEFPPTNYIIVGEKVPPGAGVRFRERRPDPVSLGFLRMSHYRDRETGRVYDLVARPHLTIDAVPWFARDDELFVLARMSYPRPILSAGPRGLDGSRPPGYVTEPLTVIQDDAPIAQTIEDALRSRAGIEPEAIVEFAPGLTYYPSPGGLREEIRSTLVRLDLESLPGAISGSSGFSTSGRIAAIEVQQILRCATVGGLPDARLELGVHALLRRCGQHPGPWIGAPIRLESRERPPHTTEVEALPTRAPRRRFARIERPQATFLSLQCSQFEELDADGTVAASRVLEYVVPRTTSLRTISVALLRRSGDDIFVAVEDDDRPAAQCIGGHSQILTTPAWRLPVELETPSPALAWIRERLLVEYGLVVGSMWPLGGRYHPSSGATPEVAHPFAADVVEIRDAPTQLLWVELRRLWSHPELLTDGHLHIAVGRAAHATGLLEGKS